MTRFHLATAFLFFCSAVSAHEPTPFTAQYSANYIGMPAKARGTRELTKTGEGHYTLSSSARSMFIKVTESSEFTIESGQIKPLHYQYSRSGIGKNKKEQMSFDWTNETIAHNGTKSQTSPALLDKLSYQQQISLDLAANRDSDQKVMHYSVADNAKRKEYRFKVTGHELLDTAAGELNTVRLERVRESSDRKTIFWLAPDHEFLLVRMEQLENGKGVVLDLKSFKTGEQ